MHKIQKTQTYSFDYVRDENLASMSISLKHCKHKTLVNILSPTYKSNVTFSLINYKMVKQEKQIEFPHFNLMDIKD